MIPYTKSLKMNYNDQTEIFTISHFDEQCCPKNKTFVFICTLLIQKQMFFVKYLGTTDLLLSTLSFFVFFNEIIYFLVNVL